MKNLEQNSQDPIEEKVPIRADLPEAFEPKDTDEDGKKSSVVIRKYKNPERPTELIYAAVPIAEAIGMKGDDVKGILERYFGSDIDCDNAIMQFNAFLRLDNPEYIKIWERRTGDKPPKPPKETLIVVRKKVDQEMKRQGRVGEVINYLNLRRTREHILITQAPAIHNIMGHRVINAGEGSEFSKREISGLTQFDDLINILEEGFYSPAERGGSRKINEGNSYIKRQKQHRINYKASGGVGSELKNKGLTMGDVFSLELFPEEGYSTGAVTTLRGDEREQEYRIIKSSTKSIASINIQLYSEATQEQKEEKKKFYKQQLSAYNIPVRFFEVSEDSQEKTNFKRVFPKDSFEVKK